MGCTLGLGCPAWELPRGHGIVEAVCAPFAHCLVGDEIQCLGWLGPWVWNHTDLSGDSD